MSRGVVVSRYCRTACSNRAISIWEETVDTPRDETKDMIAPGGTPLRLRATRVYMLRVVD